MTTYRIDVDVNGDHRSEVRVVACKNPDQLRDATMKALSSVALESSLPASDDHRFVAAARDPDGKYICSAQLRFSLKWIEQAAEVGLAAPSNRHGVVVPQDRGATG